MPLDSRAKQLSLVLDPARLSQRDRRVDRPVCSPAQRARSGESGGMSACYCFRCQWRSGFREDDSSSRTLSLLSLIHISEPTRRS
eukprot:5327805-Prymnesium_polylepis.1